jgi:hypothetical protein
MMLRKTLMSKQAITVWKAALKEWKAPDCPNDFSEPRWANLLFGGNVCQVSFRAYVGGHLHSANLANADVRSKGHPAH